MAAKTARRTINVTKAYEQFGRSADNRPLDLKKHKLLERSMRRYGFLSAFPVVCVRNAKGELIVKDGQHRIAIAKTLGLPVYWVEEAVDFDIATINCTAKGWDIRDYARKHLESGKADYKEALEFAEHYGIPVSLAFTMLAGTTSFGNIRAAFIEGDFKVRDREWADMVAGLYVPMVNLTRDLRNKAFLDACMAACRVKGFDVQRMHNGVKRCRDKLASYSNRDSYLSMLEEIYNFGVSARKIVGLKAEAIKAMRMRNAINRHANKPR